MRVLDRAILVVAAAMITAAKAPSPAHATLIANAKAATARSLIDPSSAQFRDVVVNSSPLGNAVCGEVNAKNRFGGYVGFERFVYVGGGAMIGRDSDLLWGLNCERPRQ